MLNTARLARQLQFEMQQLPQYKFLDPDDISKWIEHVLLADPERAMWHMDRLFRFGGSEIGPLCQSRRNLAAKHVNEAGYAHMTDRDIFSLKYLKSFPHAQNAAMTRGTVFEPVLLDLFERELKTRYKKVTKRDDLVNLIANANFDEFKWVRVQVDAIFECDGEIILIDAKFPSPDGLKALKYQEPVMYTGQVRIGKMIANRLGIDVAEVMVSPFDIVKCKFDNIIVPFDHKLEDELLDVGQENYHRLCNGLWPAPAFPKFAIGYRSEVPQDIQKSIVEIATLRVVSTQAKNKIDELEDTVSPYLQKLESVTQEDFRIEIGPVNLTGKNVRKFNKENARSLLLENGCDATHVEKIKNNATNLKKALKNLEIDPELIESVCFDNDYQVEVAATRAPKGDQHEILSALKVDANLRLSDATNDMVGSILELSEVTQTIDTMTDRQKRQLRTLESIIQTAPTEEIKNKAINTMNQRRDQYDVPPAVNHTSTQQVEKNKIVESDGIAQIQHLFSNNLSL